MGRAAVLALDPGGQTTIEGREARGIRRAQAGQEPGAQRLEESLDLTLALGVVRPRMDQRDAELRAHQRQVLGAVVGPVVDVQPLRQSAAQDRLSQHRQKGGGVFGECEGGVGNDAGRIVEEGDEVGLAPSAPVRQDSGPVHRVAHPQLPGPGEGEAAPIALARVFRGLRHEAMAGEQAMHRRARQRQAVGYRRGLPGLADDQLHREARGALFGRQQRLDRRRGQGPGSAAVGARFGQ
jgi:hypothetical protein